MFASIADLSFATAGFLYPIFAFLHVRVTAQCMMQLPNPEHVTLRPLVATAPCRGTWAINLYLRAMGAKIGRDVNIRFGNLMLVPDVLDIREG